MYNDELYHYGVKGMKWGVRKSRKNINDDGQSTTKKGLSKRQKTAIKVGAAAAGTVLVVYGTHKVNKLVRAKASEHLLKNGLQTVNKYLKEEVWLKEPVTGKIDGHEVAMYANLANSEKVGNMIRSLNDRTEKVGSSTIEAYKYLISKK